MHPTPPHPNTTTTPPQTHRLPVGPAGRGRSPHQRRPGRCRLARLHPHHRQGRCMACACAPILAWPGIGLIVFATWSRAETCSPELYTRHCLISPRPGLTCTHANSIASCRTSCASMPCTGQACSSPRGCPCLARCVGTCCLEPTPGDIIPVLRWGQTTSAPCAALPTPPWPLPSCPAPAHASMCVLRTHVAVPQVYGHGFLTKDGLKMGKSLGNTLDPKVWPQAVLGLVWFWPRCCGCCAM